MRLKQLEDHKLMGQVLNYQEMQQLVGLVRNAAQKLRDYPSGLRLVCADKEVISYLLDEADNWGSFLPIYLPSDLSHIVNDHKAMYPSRVYSIEGDQVNILGRLWHILGYYNGAEVRGCFYVKSTHLDNRERATERHSQKLNILIGKPASNLSDTAFSQLLNTLKARPEETVDLTVPFASATTTPVGKGRRLLQRFKPSDSAKYTSVLHYIESALFRYCLPDSRGDFSQALPPNNLHETEAWYDSDFRYSLNTKLYDALRPVEMQSQILRLIERLNKSRIIIVGGFGSGSDYLSWLALREMAKMASGSGFFRIMQFAGKESNAASLGRLLPNELQVYGAGLILRDLLDPMTAYWEHGENKYKIIKGFLHGSGGNLLQNQKLKSILNKVRTDVAYKDTRIVITTQYDSLDKLRYALENRKYVGKSKLNRERLNGAAAVLKDFEEADFWNPATEMEREMMEGNTSAMFRAWLTMTGSRIPRWLGQLYQQPQGQTPTSQVVSRSTQMQQLARHGVIAGLPRIAAWCRIWVWLLENYWNCEAFDEVEQAAKRYAQEAGEIHEELHGKNQFDIEYERTL